MATVRKTITLTEQQDAWIAAQIDAGSYTNDSEAIRDLIRREQARGFEIETIRQALPKNQPGARRVDDRRVISGIVHMRAGGGRGGAQPMNASDEEEDTFERFNRQLSQETRRME